jgi:hypothetical protein
MRASQGWLEAARGGQERSRAGNACNDYRGLADAIPRGGHEGREIVREGCRGAVAGRIVDAEGNDEEIRRLARDPG